ncbi:MAG: hypothetical protein LBL23_05475, partial [Coriobacteriales bacterium]|nr:hypothetical protein [Coriobacteriales bacterium]
MESATRSRALVVLTLTLALFLTFTLTLTPELAFGAEGDEGSAEAPSTPARIISTPAELLDFAREVNGEKTVGEEKLPARSFAGEVIELAADLDLSAYPDTRGNWKAIAPDNSHLFEGTFNGNGHTIKNLRYSSSLVGNYIGLFGHIKGATIKDLRLEGAITLPNLTSGGWPIGLLAASDAGGSTIEDVEIEGSITITREASTPSFTILDGGVALGLARRSQTTQLTHVTTKGSITITGAYGISANSVAGVAAGQATTTFIECGNEADITIDSTSTERISFISGVGSYTGSYYRCYNKGDITVTGPQTDWSYVGGISSGASSGASLFSQCYNTGNITGIHFASGITHGTPLLTVLGSYNTGTITSPRSGTTVSAVNNGVADAASTDNYSLADTVKGMRPEADTGADRSAEEFKGEGLLASLNATALSYVPVTGTEDFPRLGWELGQGEPVITETGTEPSSARIKYGESVVLSLSATSPTDERAQGSGGTLSYQWYESPYALAGWGTEIEGAKGLSYTWSPEVEDAAGYHYFYCILTNSWTEGEGTSSKSIVSPLFSVSLVTTDKVWKPVFSAEPRDTWYIQSDEWAALPALSVKLTEQADTPEAHVGDVTYQWYSNTTESREGATKLWGEESPGFSPPINTVGTTWYFCEITNTYEGSNIVTSQSALAKAVVWDYDSVRPVITAQPEPAQYVWGETEVEELRVGAKGPAGDAGEDGTLSFQWYYKRENTEPDPEADTLVAGATSATLTPDTGLALDTYYYYCVITNTFSTPYPEALGQESHALSNKALVAIVSATEPAKPVIWSATPPDADYKQKETPAPLSVTADLGDATEGFDTEPHLSYQWYLNTTGIPPEGDAPSEGDTQIEGATESVYTPPATSTLATTFYYCIVTNTFEKVKTASTASALAAITVSPLRIYTVEELKAFADFVTAPTTPAHYYDDITLVLESDLNLEEGGTLTNPWVPLGSWWKPFSGTFDGQGHTISGLHSTSEGTGGIFGVITGATIENLIVRGEVRSEANSLSGVVFSLASSPSRPTTIRNVGSEVNIYSTYAGNVDIGGIIAAAGRDSTTAGAGLTLEGCYYRGTILTTSTDMYSTYHTGGIIGSAYRYVYIRDCYNAGTIASSGSVGGIAGGLGSLYPDCLIENCYNRGTVTYASGTVRDFDHIGAIAGNASSVEAFEQYSNTWYLLSSAPKGCYYDYGPYRDRFTEVIRPVSAAELRSAEVLDALNAGRENAPWKAGEDSPQLAWEEESSSQARIVITTSPLESQTVTRFGEVSPLTVTSRIEGGSGTLSYRWYKSP